MIKPVYISMNNQFKGKPVHTREFRKHVEFVLRKVCYVLIYGLDIKRSTTTLGTNEIYKPLMKWMEDRLRI